MKKNWTLIKLKFVKNKILFVPVKMVIIWNSYLGQIIQSVGPSGAVSLAVATTIDGTKKAIPIATTVANAAAIVSASRVSSSSGNVRPSAAVSNGPQLATATKVRSSNKKTRVKRITPECSSGNTGSKQVHCSKFRWIYRFIFDPLC